MVDYVKRRFRLVEGNHNRVIMTTSSIETILDVIDGGSVGVLLSNCEAFENRLDDQLVGQSFAVARTARFGHILDILRTKVSSDIRFLVMLILHAAYTWIFF